MNVTYILLYVVIGLLTLAFYFLRKTLNYWKDRGIPYDKPHFIYGSLSGVGSSRLFQDIHLDIYRRFKGVAPFCGIFFFKRPVAFILDKQLAKNILIKDFAVFPDRGVFHNKRDDPLSGHLFALDGIKWKQLRQKLSPTFTSGKMKFMFPTVIKVADQFVCAIDDLLKQDNNIDVKEMSARFTTDVIGTCAFGIECNSLKDPDAEFRTMGRKAFVLKRHNSLIMALIQSFPQLARKIGMRTTHQDIHDFYMRIVRDTVELRESKNIKRNDFMDLLIELKTTKSIKLDNGDELTGLTIEEVAAQAFVFFLAGFETSSTTMSFALYELARNQAVQDKLRNEINEVLAKHNQEFTYDCIKDMHYLNQVLSGPRTRKPKKPASEKGSSPTQTEDKRPRTAFSGSQLARLKHEFNENRYLTEKRRQQLSSELGLNEAQIKIWFQNKRAKLKKSSGTKNPLALQLMAQGLYNHSTVPLTREEEELQELQERENALSNSSVGTTVST